MFVLSSLCCANSYAAANRRMSDELGDKRHANKKTLLFMHHAPVPVVSKHREQHYFSSTFMDDVREPLLSILDDSTGGRVQGIFTGHVHGECSAHFAGIPVYTSPSTCCQYTTNPKDGQWMVAPVSTHSASADPQAPTYDPRHPLQVPGFRVIEADVSGVLSTRVVWVFEAARVGVASL